MVDRLARYRVACDVGGTFTDFVLYDETAGGIHIEKCLTTPDDPSRGALSGLGAFDAIDERHVALTRRIRSSERVVSDMP